jgi:Domain of unknown function (DUF4292)
MKQLVLYTCVLATLITIGCGSTKKINTAIAKRDTLQVVMVNKEHADSVKFINNVLQEINKKRIDFKTFSAKAKIDYWDKEGKGPDITAFIRIKKDSIIWLSINATVFSYEAFRVMITPDSVRVLDKRNKQVQLRSVSYLRELVKLPLNFKTLQDVIVGNPVYLDSNIITYRYNANSITLLSVGEIFKNLLTCNINDYRLKHSKLDEISNKRTLTCDLTYDNYEQNNGNDVPTKRQITVVEKSKLDIQMEVKQFSFNENLNYPFIIPKNYKVQ